MGARRTHESRSERSLSQAVTSVKSGSEMDRATTGHPADFDRTEWAAGTSRLGGGEIGGKAQGLVFFHSMIEAEYERARLPGIEVSVPPFAVVTTEIFDAFLSQAPLCDLPCEALPDHAIARAFQQTPLPDQAVRFLRS